tara:strand:- start:161 stop:550 length:390 start_codon:yes stop_codon:yes gene_type:complete
MGLTPQSVNRIGGFFVQGRDPSSHSKIIEEALSLERAGAELLLLECIPDELTKKISKVIKIPTIGIGAGLETDGQIMVVHDLLGVSCLEKPPKFIKNFLERNNSIFEAFEDYVNSVKSSTFPAKENWFE